MYGPPVVGEHVEDTQYNDKEGRGPFGLEANSNHDARGQSNNRDKDTHDTPFTLDHETQEQEDEQYTARKEEAAIFKIEWLDAQPRNH
jgi:hypothetical protein